MFFRSRSAVESLNSSTSRRLLFESLETRELLAADFNLFKDINPTPAPVGIVDGMPIGIGSVDAELIVGETYFFAAVDGVHGQELWKSDGTEAGTVLVKDIYPGKESSSPSYFTELNGVLYFAARDALGEDLWRSDGTDEGTFVVQQTTRIEWGLHPSNLRQVGGRIVFQSRAGWEDDDLWSSDGTDEGTIPITKIGTNTWGEILGENSTVVFLEIFDQLWRTDGTNEGTMMLSTHRSDIQAVGMIGETFYFSRYGELTPNGPSARLLWKSDGTVAGTTMVAKSDVRLYGPTGVDIGQLLLFPAASEHGIELWKTDGTASGTTLVRDIRPGIHPSWGSALSSYPSELVSTNGVAYFFTTSPSGLNSYELWKSDGTSEGTLLVKQFSLGESTPGLMSLSAVDGTVFFSARDTAGIALWKSDGTEAGTARVKVINDGNQRGAVSRMTQLGDAILFFGDDQHYGLELWRTDGSEAGTQIVKDIRVATADSNISRITHVGDLTYFTANDGVTGEELWLSDGTAAGTRLLKDITPGLAGSKIENLTNVDGTLYFTVGDRTKAGGLWKSDGTAVGTVQLTEFENPFFVSGTRTFGNIGGTLYFSMFVDGVAEFWKSDGTETGTARVKSIAVHYLDRAITEMTNVNGTLFFSANSGVGRELWKSDGTEAGTVLVKDIDTGTDNWGHANSSHPSWLTEYQGYLYFSAITNYSYELWRSDGTATGTVRLKDLWPGVGSSPVQLVNRGGLLYFVASHGLWRSDGTEAGTSLIETIITPDTTWWIDSMISAEAKLYITVKMPQDAFSLWVSDGTKAGTTQIRSGSSSQGTFNQFANLTEWNGYIYFTTNDPSTGVELWRSDGTTAGTMLVKDFKPGYQSGVPGENRLAVMNNRLLVVATTVDHGSEFWASELDAARQPGDYDANGVVDGNDFLVWQRGYGQTAAPAGSGADGDGDGAIDADDLAIWKEHFGTSEEAPGMSTTAAAMYEHAALAVEPAASVREPIAFEALAVEAQAMADATVGHAFTVTSRPTNGGSLLALAGSDRLFSAPSAGRGLARDERIERAVVSTESRHGSASFNRDLAFAAYAERIDSPVHFNAPSNGTATQRPLIADWLRDGVNGAQFDLESLRDSHRSGGSRVAPTQLGRG